MFVLEDLSNLLCVPCKTVTSLNEGEVIDIHWFSLSYSELMEFCNYISKTEFTDDWAEAFSLY